MSLLMKRDQVIDSLQARPVHMGIRLGRFAWPVVVCIAFVTNHAAAQCAGGENPKVKTAKARSVGGSVQWVCDKPTVTIDPIWRGEQIACSFSIRNEGTGDLKIKAKGG